MVDATNAAFGKNILGTVMDGLCVLYSGDELQLVSQKIWSECLLIVPKGCRDSHRKLK